ARPVRSSRAPPPPRSARRRSRSQAIQSAGSGSNLNRCPFVSPSGATDLPAAAQGTRPSERAALWAHSSPGLLIMDGFGAEMLYSGVASQLRLPLRALLPRPAVPALLDQAVGALRGDRVHRVAGPQGGVRLAVRDIRPEAALLEDDGLAAD